MKIKFFSLLFLYEPHLFCLEQHCLKSARIRSYSGPHFPVFGLNAERYLVSLCIQSKCGKIWTRITSKTDPSTLSSATIALPKKKRKFKDQRK